MKTTKKCLLVSFVAALLSASCADGDGPGVEMTPVQQGDDDDEDVATSAPSEDAGLSSSPTEASGTDEPAPEPEPTSVEPEPTTMVEPEPTSVEPEPAPQSEPQPEPTSVEPEPTTTVETEPTSVEPEPAATEPEPVIIEPEPVIEPEPIVEPEPSPIEPEPVATEPEPVVVEPEPTSVEPEPTTVEPEPTSAEPEPVVTEPEPVVAEPEPQPEPAAEPEPMVTEPEPIVEPEPSPIEPEPAVEPEPAPPDPFCGDGNTDPGEACDDGNDVVGDGCESDCTATPPACVPTPKAPATGPLASLTCGEWEFHSHVGTAGLPSEGFATSYGLFCRTQNDCYLGGAGPVGPGSFPTYMLMHWDGASFSPETIPSGAHFIGLTGDGTEIWASGQRNNVPSLFRKIGNGPWTEEMTGLPPGPWGSFTSTIKKIGSQVFLQYMDAAGSVVIYTWSGTSWIPMAPVPSDAGVAEFWGSSANDVYAAGWTGQGDGQDALLLRWNGCDWENHSNSLPADIGVLSGVSGANGELVVVGTTDTNNGVRLVTDDLVAWDRFDGSGTWNDWGVASLGRGASIVVGGAYPGFGSFRALRSSGVWETGQVFPGDVAPDGYYAEDIVVVNGVSVVLTRFGLWTNVCE